MYEKGCIERRETVGRKHQGARRQSAKLFDISSGLFGRGWFEIHIPVGEVKGG